MRLEKSSVVIANGFFRSACDHVMFVHLSPSGLTILLYDDDISVKASLQQQFEMTDLGSLRYFIGIKVAYDPPGYWLSIVPVEIHN